MIEKQSGKKGIQEQENFFSIKKTQGMTPEELLASIRDKIQQIVKK